MCFAGATGCIVGTCRHILRLLRNRNYSCTKDYVDNYDDDVDIDNAVLVADADKDAGYGVRTFSSPRCWVLAVRGGRGCAPTLYIPIHAEEDCAAGVIAKIIILGPDSASFGITSWPCPVCLKS